MRKTYSKVWKAPNSNNRLNLSNIQTNKKLFKRNCPTNQKRAELKGKNS